MLKKYYPYVSDNPKKKFYIINDQNQKVYFGDPKYQHFTEGHLDETRKQRYITRHVKNENWNDPNTAGFWSYRFTWLYPTYKEAYENIKKKYL